ncbi:uncharacterized protein J3R85_000919 [Psidium guajava]|nr:uncharacterized protein J3R85_000919 [Psidium guajava]
MDIANSLLELVNKLWGLASKPLGYIYNLEDNVQWLRSAIGDLKDAIEDVKARVEREEEEKAAKRTRKVKNWLVKVEEFVHGVEQVLPEATQLARNKCLSRCLPRNCRSSYRLGKEVDQMLKDAKVLQTEEEKLGVLTAPLPPPRVLNLPMDETVGLDISLDKVMKWLVDEKQVGVIGLYGAGGVGKTTLMKRINEKLLRANHGFDIVIWVVVSRQVNEDGIRDATRKRLHIQDESWDRWSRDERVHQLHHDLTQKKFVLLIDDVWERLDLSKIGVPHPGLENGSKVVFTTRSESVCGLMKADKTLEVRCLTREEALKLFEENVGKSLVDCHPEIQDLARNIAEECKGLPLALITVGRAMAGKHNPAEWRDALRTLKNKPHELKGMEEDVYRILEFSYNSLSDNPTLQACFLYCCLFPEDYPIRSGELIELWIGEGVLGDTDNVYSMRDKGESLLGDLKRACLLESGLDDDEKQYVKMHDVIRDMATWIARDHGQKENKLLVIENEQDMSEEMMSKWREAEKVSLWGKRIRNINSTPPDQCFHLKTLLVRETNVGFVPRGFFDSMKARLTVLNLSNNENIESFPKEICDLIYLRYLNLSSTCINELPQEIKNLTRLRWLLLDEIEERILISIGAITSLSLNVFSKWQIDASWRTDARSLHEKEEEIVEELGCMQHLTDLSIMVSEPSSALKIFESPNLRRSIRRAHINNCEGLTRILISHSPTGNGGFPHLEVLYLYSCHSLVKVEISQGIGRAPNRACFPSLVDVHISQCGLLELSWLVHAPNLRELTVSSCRSMERIIGGEFTREELAASGLFSRLQTLVLTFLPCLTSICDQTLIFPQGVSFPIYGCHRLRKLPCDSNDARGRSFFVRAQPDWWATFEWDPTARVNFQWHGESPMEEMTYGEAARKIKDGRGIRLATIEFLPRGAERASEAEISKRDVVIK